MMSLRSFLAFWFASFGSLALFGCGQGNEAADRLEAESVNIRISNETGVDLETVWLGTGVSDTAATFATRFVNVGSGSTSEYLPVEPITFNYSRVQVSDGSRRWSSRGFDPHATLAVDELEAGVFYTFVITIVEDTVVLADVTVDR